MFLVDLFLSISMFDGVFRSIRFWWLRFFSVCECVQVKSFDYFLKTT